MCRKCDKIKPKRAHHCSICNVCILKMDHHCPWINNCVGHQNQRYLYYILYTIVLAFLIILKDTFYYFCYGL